MSGYTDGPGRVQRNFGFAEGIESRQLVMRIVSMNQADELLIDPFDTPALSPEGETTVCDETEFEDVCHRLALGGMSDLSVIASLVTRCEAWGLVWRGDVVTPLLDDDRVRDAYMRLLAKGVSPAELRNKGPRRVVVWRVNENFVLLSGPAGLTPIFEYFREHGQTCTLRPSISFRGAIDFH